MRKIVSNVYVSNKKKKKCTDPHKQTNIWDKRVQESAP